MGKASEVFGGRYGNNSMDPVVASLAANVVAVLAPYITMGAQEFVKSAGREAYEKAKGMLDALKARWSEDEEATDALTRFEDKPQRYAPVLEDILKEKLIADKELAAVLFTLLEEMGPRLEVVQKMDEARRVTGLEAEQMSAGRASVRQDIGRGEDVTGARIRRIGPQE